jgi:hemolysin III
MMAPIESAERARIGRMQNPVRGLLHGFAAVAAVAGTVFLAAHAAGWPNRIAVIVFGLGMVALYTTSSLYHAVPWRAEWKRRMQRLDHSMIFVLIAATYTPVSVIALDGVVSVVSLAGAWAIAAVGIAQQAFAPRERNTFGIALMTTLGWMAVFVMWPLAQTVGIAPVLWFAAGGVLYTVGMVLVVTQRPRLWPRVFSYHEVFHVLVVLASVLHFAATYRYLAPLAV